MMMSVMKFPFRRPSPQKDASAWNKGRAGGGGTSSFQDFQDSVRDAWDIEDDEFAAMASGTMGRLSSK